METLMDTLRSIWAFIVLLAVIMIIGLIFFAGH